MSTILKDKWLLVQCSIYFPRSCMNKKQIKLHVIFKMHEKSWRSFSYLLITFQRFDRCLFHYHALLQSVCDTMKHQIRWLFLKKKTQKLPNCWRCILSFGGSLLLNYLMDYGVYLLTVERFSTDLLQETFMSCQDVLHVNLRKINIF